MCCVRGEFRLDVGGMAEGEMGTWQDVDFVVVCFDRAVARSESIIEGVFGLLDGMMIEEGGITEYEGGC